jgi:hypothetical protein
MPLDWVIDGGVIIGSFVMSEVVPENITVTFALEPPEEQPELIDVTPRKEIEN